MLEAGVRVELELFERRRQRGVAVPVAKVAADLLVDVLGLALMIAVASSLTIWS